MKRSLKTRLILTYLAVALVTRLGVSPEANPTSTALTEAAAATHDRLETLEGAAFDAAYVANEVAFHRTVNSALAGTLIPYADNAELKALLETLVALDDVTKKNGFLENNFGA